MDSSLGGKIKKESDDGDHTRLSTREKKGHQKRSVGLILFFLLPFWMFLLWFFSPCVEKSVFIMDKTVPNQNFQEHKAFFWVLRYLKWVKPDDSFYNPSDDYYGFFPVEPGLSYFVDDLEHVNSQDLELLADSVDMAVFLDGYGVYRQDWWGRRDGDEISRLYGGISLQDIRFLELLQSQGKPAMAEFSFLGSPTPYDVRRRIEKSFNLKSTGWTGRYFDDLDILNTDIPRWIFETYQEQYDTIWELKGPGTILVHENGTILILQAEKHLRTYWPVVSTDKAWQKKLRVPDEIRYPFWFEIIAAGPEYTMISEFYLDVTEAGDSLLSLHNVPNAFPATLIRREPSPFLYYAGDFSDTRVNLRTAHLWGIQYFRSLFYNEGEPLDRDKFFWDYYINVTKGFLRGDVWGR
ncbi:MAG: hypothetical protein J7K63_08235 [Candidatus Marinimicrobia bacterium]|nr:hypothetical protein [Candidatus Neomarinimicrobiota bacterium]